jgi:Fic family protein
MKLEKPPTHGRLDYDKYFEVMHNPEYAELFNESDKRYFYWNELKYRPNLPTKDALTAWEIVTIHRIFKSSALNFENNYFTYYVTSYIQKDLHDFDLKLMGGLYKDSITPEDQREYFKNSLLEEAIASSQIEGASTTTEIAREMIKSGRAPMNESEQMIVNNYGAIREIEVRLNDELDNKLILDIHSLMTNKTEASKYAGSFRNAPIYVQDHIDGEIAHTAPDHEEIQALMNALYKFVNQEEEFIHPIIKASILHFMIGYIHPFGDGNGRTARALFYWYLMKKGYSLVRHISISRAILSSRVNYDKAFLKTEYDRNDLTYFIMYSIKSLRVAFKRLVDYRDRKRDERTKAIEIKYDLTKTGLSKRQADLLSYLYMKPEALITIPQYSKRHDIVRQTGSKDLVELEKMGILESYKEKKVVFYKLVSKDSVIKLIH